MSTSRLMEVNMKRSIAVILCLAFVAPSLTLASVDSKRAAYTGGTATVFNGAKDPIEGDLNTADSAALTLTARDKPFRGVALVIPYNRVVDLEYGQKAGRRVGAAVGTAILLGPLGLLALFSHKRNHYLTIGYKDEADKDQVAVLEIGKDIIRTTLAIMETRTAKKVTYQDEEARKSGLGK